MDTDNSVIEAWGGEWVQGGRVNGYKREHLSYSEQ